MPYYYFDLIVEGHPYDQGSMILQDMVVASDRADALAIELNMVKPELRNRDCYVRVTDENNQEIYRAPFDPIRPPKSVTSERPIE